MKVNKCTINNRRFLGNKYKLLSFIKGVVDAECEDISSVADIFSGTGSVASAFLDKKIITNDLLYSNYICNLAWFSGEKYDENKLTDIIYKYNKKKCASENYMTKNFSNTYFSYEDCSKIGYIRQNIETLYKAKKINDRERAILIASLIYAMDKIAQTCGHYDAYRKDAKFDTSLELTLPNVSNSNKEDNECFNMDANELVRKITVDLVYIDPPYNSRQYSGAYHLLENVACWNKPKVYGKAKKMNRDSINSKYCTKEATKSFEDLIQNINSKYILFSYNNMAKKGNDRSNAKITDDDIIRILKSKGTVSIFAQDYKAFSTGKSDIQNNQERLFLCKCR